MPSDVKPKAAEETPLVEPPSMKLMVRLFLIPLLIVAAAVGVMFLIGRLAGGTPTFEEALQRLKAPAGNGRRLISSAPARSSVTWTPRRWSIA
jgi:hypothetical protein